MILTPDLLTQQIFYAYDRNQDGAIQLRKGNEYEAERLQRQVQAGYQADTLSLSWVSHERLFQAADHNRDGLTTKDELRNTLRLFDTNLDNQIDSQELAYFQKSYPVAQGLISSEQVARQSSLPNQGYSFYAMTRTLAAISVGFGAQLPSRN